MASPPQPPLHAYSGDEPYVFASYAHADSSVVYPEFERLGRLGFHIWYDEGIEPGNEWPQYVADALARCSLFLVFVSPRAVASRNVRHEIHFAINHNKPFLAVHIEPTDLPAGLELRMGDTQAILKHVLRDERYQAKLMDALRALLGRDAQPDHPQGTPAGPPRGPISSVWNVPDLCCRHFTGRDALLAELRAALTPSPAPRQVEPVVLHGLSGVGKTQLVVQYAHRHRGDYAACWWVQSDDPSRILSDYVRLAERLGLPEREADEPKVIIGAVRRWLADHGRWLLVFDNAACPEDIVAYVPRPAAGHVVVTSLNPNWGSLATTLAVHDLGDRDAAAFLTSRTGQDDEHAAAELARALGNLPLVLEHAGAYVEQTGLTLADYLDLFRTRRRELWEATGALLGYGHDLLTTWTLAFEQVREQMPAAWDLLSLCAHLAAEQIPRSLLAGIREHVGYPPAAALGDPLTLNNGVATLRRYSLLDATPAALAIHRLVQLVTRDQLSPDDRRAWAAAAVDLLGGVFAFDPSDLETWRDAEALLPHASSAAANAAELGLTSTRATDLANRATTLKAWLLKEHGRWQKSLEVLEGLPLFHELTETGAEALADAAGGAEPPDHRARFLEAWLLKEQGSWQESLEVLGELRVFRDADAAAVPDLAKLAAFAYEIAADCYHLADDYAVAEAYCRQSYAIDLAAEQWRAAYRIGETWAQVLELSGALRDAEQKLRDVAAEIRGRAGDPAPEPPAKFHYRHGALARLLYQLDRAQTSYQRCASTARRRVTRAYGLRGLGEVALLRATCDGGAPRAEQLDEAEALLHQAEAICEATGHRGQIWLRRHLAEIQRQRAFSRDSHGARADALQAARQQFLDYIDQCAAISNPNGEAWGWLALAFLLLEPGADGAEPSPADCLGRARALFDESRSILGFVGVVIGIGLARLLGRGPEPGRDADDDLSRARACAAKGGLEHQVLLLDALAHAEPGQPLPPLLAQELRRPRNPA